MADESEYLPLKLDVGTGPLGLSMDIHGYVRAQLHDDTKAQLNRIEAAICGSDCETFYRVRAAQVEGEWRIGYGDGLYDRAAAERHFDECVVGGWPFVRLEEVRVRVLKSHGTVEAETAK